MKMRFFVFVTFLLGLLAPSLSWAEPACEKGDKVTGVVCVNVKKGKAGSRTLPVSTVYKAGAPSKVLWQDIGFVDSATAKVLTVIEIGGSGTPEEVAYKWDSRTQTYH